MKHIQYLGICLIVFRRRQNDDLYGAHYFITLSSLYLHIVLSAIIISYIFLEFFNHDIFYNENMMVYVTIFSILIYPVFVNRYFRKNTILKLYRKYYNIKHPILSIFFFMLLPFFILALVLIILH